MSDARIVQPRCPECKGPMPEPKTVGRPRRWCSDECRYRARHRRNVEPHWSPWGDQIASIPTDPETRRRRTFVEVAKLLEGEAAAPPEDVIAQALIEARMLAFQLRRAAVDVVPGIAKVALGVADAIEAGLAEHFPDAAPDPG